MLPWKRGSGINIFNIYFTQKNPLYNMGITNCTNDANKINPIQVPYLPLSKEHVINLKTLVRYT